MKKYITLLLGYGIVFQVFVYIGFYLLGTLGSILLLIVGGIGTAIGATLIDFSNITFGNMSVISIFFNVIILIGTYFIFYIILKMVSDWAFAGNVKSGYFTKKTINMDIVYSTICISLIPIAFVVLNIIEKGDYSYIGSSLIYIISFIIVIILKAKKEFITNK